MLLCLAWSWLVLMKKHLGGIVVNLIPRSLRQELPGRHPAPLGQVQEGSPGLPVHVGVVHHHAPAGAQALLSHPAEYMIEIDGLAADLCRHVREEERGEKRRRGGEEEIREKEKKSRIFKVQ